MSGPADEAVLTPRDDLVVEVFDDGAVLWDDQHERLHRLDPVGAAVWTRLDGRGYADLCADLASAFGADEQTVRADVAGFLSDMLEQGLLTQEPPRPT